MPDTNTENVASLIELAGEITIAWLQNPNVKPEPQDVQTFLKDMHSAVTALSNGPAPEPEAVTHQPAAPVRSSVKSDHIVSLIDGKKYKTLKRHLGQHGLTPAAYRERYGLKPDYPMVAPGYAEQRREIAKKLGLGRKPAVKSAPAPTTDAAPATEVAKPKRAAAKPKVEASAASVAVPAPRKQAGAPAKAKRPAAKVAVKPKAAAPKRPAKASAAKQPASENAPEAATEG